MKPVQRKVTMITSYGKKYSGLIDIPNESYRTTDLFNSPHVYWKSPDLKAYDDTILMSDASLSVKADTVYRRFSSIQIRLSEIIYLYDDISEIGNEREKKRAFAFATRHTNAETQKINIITTHIANSFYDIKGMFSGLFRKKTKDLFVPLIQVSIQEIYKKEGKWFRKKVELPNDFICVGSQYIESLAIG